MYREAGGQAHAFFVERGLPTDPAAIEKRHVEAWLIYLREERMVKPATLSARFLGVAFLVRRPCHLAQVAGGAIPATLFRNRNTMNSIAAAGPPPSTHKLKLCPYTEAQIEIAMFVARAAASTSRLKMPS
jgi:hypothetical protein